MGLLDSFGKQDLQLWIGGFVWDLCVLFLAAKYSFPICWFFIKFTKISNLEDIECVYHTLYAEINYKDDLITELEI